eukprot:8208786-Lingulodinium_polyedra.AAC.1
MTSELVARARALVSPVRLSSTRPSRRSARSTAASSAGRGTAGQELSSSSPEESYRIAGSES